MKNNETIRVAVAENSVIIRSGLTLALKRLPNLKIQPVELLSVEALHDCLRTQYPDILVVNPTFGDYFDVARFREETTGKGIRVVALVSSFIDATLLMIWKRSPIRLSVCRILHPMMKETDRKLLASGRKKS